ncbi:PAAR domain-containing protein [Streptomyces olivoreticuli]|uniref:PAAR domain-containing protein n=1 Tax=Streptomyces olivoreticuli TaxID=68246 RepID=UPI00265A26EE|nr:PAAR domain-containing protein [Streptomyces olivoreticuli]WKK24346.1 PAAR domain-containing protein [Streptomyces olivoreticuli]
MPAAVRVGDATSHIPNPTPVPVPAGTGAVTGPPMAADVLIGGRPAAVTGALSSCAFPGHVPPLPPMPLVVLPMPGKTVLIGGQPAAVTGAKLPCGAAVVGGCPTVMIGG